jgi:hypothetical protein
MLLGVYSFVEGLASIAAALALLWPAAVSIWAVLSGVALPAAAGRCAAGHADDRAAPGAYAVVAGGLPT